jgi:type II secretory pathway pseudopilin PulG
MKLRKPKSEPRNESENGSPPPQPGRPVRSACEFRALAFSLIELLVVMALLSVIIVGLMLMFSQVQRAFRTGLTQTDVLAAGRVAGDMLGRELEQITPVNQPRWINPANPVQTANFNFYARIPSDANYNAPFVQPIPGSPLGSKLDVTIGRTNLIHDLFFVSKRNQDWVAIGYFVRTNNPQTGVLGLSPLGVGTLYRFETNATPLSGRSVGNMFNEFSLARFNEQRATKLVDGVIHFKVRAFDTNGAWMVTNNATSFFAGDDLTTPRTWKDVGGEVELYEFWSNAVPATVELEMGLLEDKVWQHFQALPTIAAQTRYLTNQTGRVHLFRSRVPVRNVDPVAYP